MEIYLRSDARRPAFVPDRRADLQVGRRQQRRLLQLRAGLARPRVPRPRQARRRGVPLGVRLRRPRRRALVDPHRVEPQRPRHHVRRPTAASRSPSRASGRPDARNWLRARRRRERDDHPRLPRRSGARRADASTRSRPSRRSRRPPPLERRRGRGPAALGHELPARAARDHAAPRPGRAQHDRRRVGRARRDLRMGGEGRALRDGLVRPRRRRAARDRGPLARVRVLGLHALEPVHADVRLPLRAHRHQRRAGGLRARRLVAARDRAPAIPVIRTGCRPRVTGAACCSSAGSSPSETPPTPVAHVERTGAASATSSDQSPDRFVAAAGGRVAIDARRSTSAAARLAISARSAGR